MQIQILQLIEGARKASGLTVIIDVFRAFTVACYLSDRGVKRIYPIGDISQAYSLKKENPDFLLVGERHEQKPEGFDFGNSPTHIFEANIVGKTVVHTTSAGTQGIVNATNADQIITGSFVNADAVVRYIQSQDPQIVSLCCMGYAALRPSEEDTLFAEYVKYKLQGKSYDFNHAVEVIKNSSGKRFFMPEKQHFSPESDFHLCMKLNVFDFVLKVEKDENNMMYLNKIIV